MDLEYCKLITTCYYNAWLTSNQIGGYFNKYNRILMNNFYICNIIAYK